MSDSTVSLVVPSEVVLRHKESEYVEAQSKIETEQLRKAKAVLFLDKVQHEKTIKELEPRREEVTRAMAKADADLQHLGAQAVGDLKPGVEFADVKKALRALKIYAFACHIEFVGTNIENNEIEFRRSINDGEKSSYRVIDGCDTLKFTPEMKERKAEWKALKLELQDIERKLMEARTALRDRANRMADVEGAIALKNLNDEERVEVKELYTQLATGLNAHKLLGDKKD